MRYAHCFKLLMIILVLSGAANAASITTSLIPSLSKSAMGDTIHVEVIIDISELSKQLGSYTAKATWNPQELSYANYEGGTTTGFENPYVNPENIAEGLLIFAAANPYGASGEIHIITLNFNIIGELNQEYNVDIEFTAMAAAFTFEDLLPLWENLTNSAIKLNPADVITSFVLQQNHPNPFNPVTEIGFQLPKNSNVQMNVFNSNGQLVKTLINRDMVVGSYTVTWDGRNDIGNNVPSGMYLLVLNAGNFRDEKKLLLVR